MLFTKRVGLVGSHGCIVIVYVAQFFGQTTIKGGVIFVWLCIMYTQVQRWYGHSCTHLCESSESLSMKFIFWGFSFSKKLARHIRLQFIYSKKENMFLPFRNLYSSHKKVTAFSEEKKFEIEFQLFSWDAFFPRDCHCIA